jgi:hypothetical protein
MTRLGLLLGLEHLRIPIRPELRRCLEGLPRHRRFAPGYAGPDLEHEIARARALEHRQAQEWLRKTGGRRG